MTYQVRDGQRVVPTCPECGCRLDTRWPLSDGGLSHYWPEGVQDLPLKDAQGHTCKYTAGWLTFKEGKVYHNRLHIQTITEEVPHFRTPLTCNLT